LEADWEEGYNYLKLYKERMGHCRVPHRHKENGFALGLWVFVQRMSEKRMSEQRRQKLDELGFVWGVLSERWEEGYRHLKSYKERRGHCRVPVSHSQDGYPLGMWVREQRHKDKMSDERRERLDRLGFDWHPSETDWEKGFSLLKSYKERMGNCRVPKTHEEDGFHLGQWVRSQRYSNVLSEDRRRRLDHLGFVWGLFQAAWNKGLGYLIIFKKREGHCRVPRGHKESGYSLGSWVKAQRHNKSLSEERREQLCKLGFDWSETKDTPDSAGADAPTS